MATKIVLVINALVYLLLGLAFTFIPGQFTMSMGALSPLGEVFTRALGEVFIGLSIISWYAKDAAQSKILQGVILGNMAAHFLQAGGDIYAMQRGFLNASGLTSISIHVVLGVAFLFVLCKKKTSKKK